MELVQSDVTVVGGGIAGVCAAIAAARNGLAVALINDRPVLGGNASSEVRVHINGSAYQGRSPSYYGREGGLVEELKQKLFRHNPLYNQKIMYSVSDTVLLDMVYGEPNIALYLNTCVYETGTEGGRVARVDALQLASERKFRFVSPYYIDSSGDGAVAYQAGAQFRRGREARSEFGESLAPEEADAYTMGDTILFQTRDVGRKVPFKRPAFAYDVTKLSFFEDIRKGLRHRVIPRKVNGLGGLWWLEYGGHIDTVRDNEEIALELRKLVFGIWDYIKNSGDFDGVDPLILDHVSPIPGKRESRRFVGDYMLSQNDLTERPYFADAVAVGGWAMDLHAAKGVYDTGPATAWNFVPGLYNIPLRSLYSANVPNLLLAGRNVSATHVAFGSTRVMATCGCMGQAVGTAAALCVKYGADPADIAAEHIGELQRMLMRDGQTIVGLREELTPCFAEGLTVRASSRRAYANEVPGEAVSLEQPLCLALPIGTERLESVAVRIRNAGDRAETLRLTVLGGDRKENYVPGGELKRAGIEVAAGFDGWMTLDIGCGRPAGDKLYLVFEGAETLALSCNGEKPTGAVSFLYRPEEPAKLRKWEKSILFKNLLPAQHLYDPANIVNGYSRPYGLPNVWASERSGGREWLELAFATPKDVEELQLVFNPRLDLEHFDEPPETLVKDYDAIVTLADGSERRFEARGNDLTLNRYRLNVRGVVRIRFEFGGTHGSPYVEVFAVKLYAPEVKEKESPECTPNR
ncbi:FAD-dependent oxidoreductase [Cohnella zeiphila]|uniref:FAD-dependent oxidoreductase n=1 Tax=Cohnella zeiphila TaxID=2761120 RepID=A0A7X0SJS5_9BACL|nr:FAD-dependent oxidoreductase [Cohnella zeiphila]MBB6731254.1 FAD-dependent oxidoreductase [Cohnella zeiphila]